MPATHILPSFSAADAASHTASAPLTISDPAVMQHDPDYLRRLAAAELDIAHACPRAPRRLCHIAAEAIADHGMTAAGTLFIADMISAAAEDIAAAGTLTFLQHRDTMALALLIGGGAGAQYARHRC